MEDANSRRAQSAGSTASIALAGVSCARHPVDRTITLRRSRSNGAHREIAALEKEQRDEDTDGDHQQQRGREDHPNDEARVVVDLTYAAESGAPTTHTHLQ